jgi:acylphosphatase
MLAWVYLNRDGGELMNETAQFRAIVRGFVQGVYYRAQTVKEAQALGLAGYARNRDDGSVEVVAQGPKSDLERLIDFLHRGPSLARVTGVELDWNDHSSAPRPFVIRF